MSDAEQIFRDTLHAVAKDHNIHNYDLTIKPLSTGGANYTSHLFLAKIKGSEDVDIFGKVAACGEKMRESAPVKLYDNERYFYNILSKVYKEIEEKSGVTEEEKLKLPKYYGCNPNLYEETIVLENLESRGFTTYDRMKSFDLDYALAALSQLAKFHALSMAFRRDHRETFEEDVARLKLDADRDPEEWKPIMNNFMKPALDAVREEHKAKLRTYVDSIGTESYKELIAAKYIDVIIHGDYRPSNLMHRTQEPAVPVAASIMSDAEQIFRDTLHAVAKDHNIHNYDLTIKPLSTGGANYTSHLFLAKIKGSEDVDIFGKVAACGKKMRESAPVKVYDNERYFYNILSKVYKEIEEKSGVTEEEKLKLPKYYGCNPNLYEETIILEDLESRGFTTYDRMKSFDLDYALAALSQLAKFHALSMAFRRDYRETFEEDVARLKLDAYRDPEEWKTVMNNFSKPAMDAVREEHKAKLRTFVDNIGMESNNELIEAKYFDVIIHGDYRPSNLMHRTQEDGKIEVVPVDFQTLRGGSPIIDLLYFIYTGSDEEFRRLHYQQLVDHYYSELSAAMDRLGVDPGTYSRENFDDELKEKLVFGLFVGIFLLPLVTVEAENAPQMGKEMDISSFSIKKPGQLFPERFNGIVNDYVRWGILV